MDKNRFCYFCKQFLSEDMFTPTQKKHHGGREVGRCKLCTKKKNTEYRLAHIEELKEYSRQRNKNPERREYDRKRSYKRRYGITKEEYESRLAEQEQCCFICKVDEKVYLSRWGVLCLDHNHKTGQLRKFLCAACNKGLGCFKDSAELLERASKYLLSFEQGVSSK